MSLTPAHFNLRDNSGSFLFLDGSYLVEVFASVVGRKPAKLAELIFTVDGLQSAELIQIPKREMFLLWNAESRTYDGHVTYRLAFYELSLELACVGVVMAVEDKKRSRYPLRLPQWVRREAQRLAKEDGVSLNHWISVAVAQKIGAVETAAEFLKRRAAGATGEELQYFLSRVPNRPPDPGDEIE